MACASRACATYVTALLGTTEQYKRMPKATWMNAPCTRKDSKKECKTTRPYTTSTITMFQWMHYYFPFKEWMQDMYTKPDLSQFMGNDINLDAFPSGHVRRSDGWRRKVSE
jgi:hypothetical protein